MPDELVPPQLPMDVSPSWLARNRKIAILIGLVVILAAAAVATYLWPRRGTTGTNTNTTGTSTTNTRVTNSATYTRPTFQRSTITNTSAAPPAKYQPPNQQDLRQAIDRLKLNTNQ